MFSLQNHLIAI